MRTFKDDKNDSEGLTTRLWVAASVPIITEKQISGGFSGKKTVRRREEVFKRSANPQKL